MFDSVTFFRVIRAGFVNYWRNIWLSAAATMVMTITLVIFSILGILFGLTQYSVTAIKSRVDVSVYFKAGVAESLVQKMTADLKQNSKVTAVTYVSAEEALQNFKSKHANDPLILDSLAELTANPLPATLQIKAQRLEDYADIAKSVQDGAYKDSISKVNFEDNRLLIERLGRVLRFIVSGGVILVAIFSLIAVLVIFNTITLTIYNRREEVEIMRLVGATNWYIRGPFIIEALLYSIVGTLITSLLLAGLIAKISPLLALLVGSRLGLGADGGTGLFQTASLFNVPFVSLALLAIAVLLSVVSSVLAIRKYLRV